MSPLPESLVQVARGVVEDEDLALWFESLVDEPPTGRAAEFRAMAARMQAGGADADLTHAIRMLAVPGAYEDVLSAVRELRASE